VVDPEAANRQDRRPAADRGDNELRDWCSRYRDKRKPILNRLRRQRNQRGRSGFGHEIEIVLVALHGVDDLAIIRKPAHTHPGPPLRGGQGHKSRAIRRDAVIGLVPLRLSDLLICLKEDMTLDREALKDKRRLV
jgi:hypothetical protein